MNIGRIVILVVFLLILMVLGTLSHRATVRYYANTKHLEFRVTRLEQALWWNSEKQDFEHLNEFVRRPDAQIPDR